MDLVQVCLGAGEASRLKKRLVHGSSVAISASVGWSWRIDPGVVLAYAELAPGVKPARVEKLLFEEVARLAADGPTAWELRRARALLRSGVLHDLGTHHGLAQAMGHAEALLGDWREAGRVLDRYADVTAAEVRRVAARYLAPGLRSVVTLVPGAAT
jgi:predicted Zn-dependent peptidase